jgi:hypothetical protein
LGTKVADSVIGSITESDQKHSRTIPPLDLELNKKLQEVGGSWLRVWGTTKAPAEFSALERQATGIKQTPEVALVVDVPTHLLSRPDIWKSYLCQPAVRFIAGLDQIPLSAFKEILVTAPHLKSRVTSLVTQHSVEQPVVVQSFPEKSSWRETVKFVARPLSYLTCALGAIVYSDLPGMYAQVTAGLATSITIATMLSVVDTSLTKRALKTFGDRLKVLLADDTGGVISQGLRLPTAKECRKYLFGKLLEGVFDLRPKT